MGNNERTGCLICGKNDTLKRGLCNQHYMQWNRAMKQCPEALRKSVEEKAIEEGKLLPIDRSPRESDKNEFQKLVQEVCQEFVETMHKKGQKSVKMSEELRDELEQFVNSSQHKNNQKHAQKNKSTTESKSAKRRDTGT